MACFRLNHDEGYATPAAMVLALGLALLGAGVTARALQGLALSRTAFEQSRQIYALDGAQLQAAAAVVRSGGDAPFAWDLSTDVGWVRVLAEPEAGKLSLQAAARLDDAVLSTFGAADPEHVRQRLAEAAASSRAADPSDFAADPTWRACAGRFASRFGAAEAYGWAEPREPGVGSDEPNWHVGETWRIRVTSLAGWRDDRVVRFTGDARRPAAIVVRRFYRGARDHIECSDKLKALEGAALARQATP